MNRIAAALLYCLLATGAMPDGAHAGCDRQGPINICLDEDLASGMGEDDAYERLDGRVYDNHAAGSGTGKVVTIGDTKVTLGPTEDSGQPWQAFNRKFGDYDSLAREDRPRDGGDPLQYKCYPDGCY